jgi:urease accessory protein
VIATELRGCATLVFARQGDATRLVQSRVSAPLAVVRPFELPDGRLVIQLVTVGPGLCGGDTVRIDVTVEDGASIVLTTTAATRIMSMHPGDRARQHVRLRAGREASLEYYPALAIPFPGSALTQTLEVEADATSRIGVVESWALGRSARDEYLLFRALSSRTTLTMNGTLVYADALQLEPASDDVANAGVLDGRRYLASGVFSGIDLPPEGGSHDATSGSGLQPEPHSDVDDALALTRPGLAYLRVLANDAPALDAAVQSSLERIALAWGRPAVRFDRFRC